MVMASNARKRSALQAALAAEVRAERAAQDMTQQELANRAGMSRQVLLRIENEERVPDVTQVADLAAALGLTLTDLTRRAEARVAAAAPAAGKEATSG